MKVEGLSILCEVEIEERAATLLRQQREDYFDYVLPTQLLKLAQILTAKFKIVFDFNASLGFSETGERILGATNLKKWIIRVDQALQKDQHKFNFTLAHELGHLALHRKITFCNNEPLIQEPINTIIEVYSEKNTPKNELEILEWQANVYATVLLMPEKIIQKKLVLIQKEIGIRNPGKILIDDQYCNMSTYYNIISKLSDFFGTSSVAVEARLEKLNLIETNISGVSSISEILNSMNWSFKERNEYNPFK